MKQVTLRVEGMHCQGCAQVIEALLAALLGTWSIRFGLVVR